MPGTGTYTQDEVDALIAGLQDQINLSATRAEVATLGASHNTKIQANINDLTTANNDVRNLQSNVASLNRREYATSTQSVFLSATGVGTYGIMQPPTASTITQIGIYIDNGNAEVQVYNNGTGMMNTKLTGIGAAWNTVMPDSGAGVAISDVITYQILGNTGASDIRLQIDYTV